MSLSPATFHASGHSSSAMAHSKGNTVSADARVPAARGLPAASGQATFDPTSFYIIEPGLTVTVASDEQFEDFLTFLVDGYGRKASVIWYMSDLGTSGVSIGACIVNQHSRRAHTYAVVQDFITRDCTHVLFRVKIKVWVTLHGHCKPTVDTFAFLIVPVEITKGYWSGEFGDFLGSPMPLRLIDQVHDVAKKVQNAVVNYTTLGLIRGDPLTAVFLITYRSSPVMRYFAPERDHAVTIHRADLELPIGYHTATAPSKFNPELDEETIAIPHVSEDGVILWYGLY